MSHTELKQLLATRLNGKASPLFLERIGKVIDGAENGNLSSACTKVAHMVGLFIDKKLGDRLAQELIELIELT